MSDSVSVSGPVHIQSDGKERVAYALMTKIGQYEKDVNLHDRDYWLKLYGECFSMTCGIEFRHLKANRSQN